MEKNYNDIAYIESWLRGELDETARRAFEAQLKTDAALRQELDAYRKIFNGFNGLKQENFAAEVSNWTKSAKSKDRKMSKNKPENRIAMKKQGATIRPMWQRVAVAASIAVLLAAGGGWWKSRQYTDENLVASAYIAPLDSGTMGGNNQAVSDLEKQFNEAHRLFQEEKYEEAGSLMGVVIKGAETSPNVDKLTRKFYLENARWTKFLAEFAMGRIEEKNVPLILDYLVKNSSYEYSEKAKEFQADLNSAWRKMGK